MKRQELAPGIFTIRGVLTAGECQQRIAFAEARGFDAATINAFGVQRLDQDTRNNDRVIDDEGSEVTGGVKYVLRSDVMYGTLGEETRGPK